MASLINYGSSDEEEEEAIVEGVNNYSQSSILPSQTAATHEIELSRTKDDQPLPQTDPSPSKVRPPLDSQTLEAPLGPAMPLPEPDQSAPTPQSPYSQNREVIQNLTLPSIPNLDIPPSPPGSPPPGVDGKIAHFLRLKTQGVHFNEKLASSSALKNPSLLGKLMASAGLDEEQQYATSLRTELWDPACFPEWAYKEGLLKAQQEAEKLRQEETVGKARNRVDFMPAQSGVGNENATHVASMRTEGRSAAQRVIAGLSRDGGSSRESSAGPTKKTRFDEKGRG